MSNLKKRLTDYESPGNIGSLGGVILYAKANKIPISQAKSVLELNLANTLHKPRRRREELHQYWSLT